MQDKDVLIALLEREIAAGLAREQQLRECIARVLDDANIRPDAAYGKFHSTERRSVHSRLLGRLSQLIEEPMDDRRLRLRLEQARYEATHE